MTLTDQLLSEILQELKSGGGGGGGGGSGGGGGGGGGGSTLFNPFKAAFSIASGAVSTLGSAASRAANGVLSLAQAAEDGNAGLGSLAGMVSNMLPKSLGIFGTALTFAAQLSEKNLSTQQALGQAGATFAGSLIQMRIAASQSYLSLQEFTGAVSKNSDIFRTMGGNVQDGVNQFARIQKTLLQPGSDTSAMLATMGVSAQEAADLTASYMRSQGSMNKQELQDSKRVAEAVGNYASELTVLSQLTGKSRKELQEKMDAENAEAQWAQMLASMSPEKAEKMRQGMQTAMAQGGQGAVDAFKAMAMGMAPMTEAGRLYMATQEAGAASLEKIHQAAMDDSISSTKAQQINREALAKAIADGAGDMEKMRTVLQAGGLTGSALARTLADAQKMQTSFMKDGKMMSEKEIVAKLAKMDADTKLKETEAKTVQDQQRAWQELTNRILISVMPVLTRFMTMITSTSIYIGNLLVPVIAKVSDYFNKLLVPLSNIGVEFVKRVIAPFFEGVFRELDLKSALTPMIDFFKSAASILGTVDWKGIGAELGKMVMNLWTATVDFFKPLLLKAEPIFRQIGTDLGPVLKEVGEIISLIIGIIRKYVLPVITPIAEGILNAMLPMWEGFKNIIRAIKQLLSGDFESLSKTMGTLFDNFTDALKKFFAGIKEAILKLDPRNWKFFGGSGVPEPEPVKVLATPTPRSTTGGAQQPATPSPAVGSKPPATTPQAAATAAAEAAEAAARATPAGGQNRPETTLSGTEPLLAELKLLNRQTTDVIRFLRDTAEYSKRSFEAIRALDGNQFP